MQWVGKGFRCVPGFVYCDRKSPANGNFSYRHPLAAYLEELWGRGLLVSVLKSIKRKVEPIISVQSVNPHKHIPVFFLIHIRPVYLHMAVLVSLYLAKKDYQNNKCDEILLHFVAP